MVRGTLRTLGSPGGVGRPGKAQWLVIRPALGRIVVLFAAFVALYFIAVRSAAGQRLDVTGFAVAASIGGRWPWAYAILRDGLPWLLAAATLLLAVRAVFKRRWRDLIGAVLAVASAPLLTHILRLVLPRPFLGANGYAYNTFPSGHAAAIGSLLFAIYVISPRRFRGPRLGIGCAVITAAAGSASVMSYAHRPSDVVGALLVVAMAGVVALAATANDVLPVWPPWSRAVWAVAVGAAAASGGWWILSGCSAAAAVSYAGVVVALSLVIFGLPSRRSRPGSATTT